MKKLLILLMLISGEAMAITSSKNCEYIVGRNVICDHGNESCVYHVTFWTEEVKVVKCFPKPKSK